MTKVIDCLTSSFDYCEFTITRGKKHTYVGMDIDYSNDESVSSSLVTYILEAIDTLAEDLKDNDVSTPASEHLFDVNPSSPPLSNERRELLHSITTKLLFVTTRGYPDIYTPYSFLTSRVSNATEGD